MKNLILWCIFSILSANSIYPQQTVGLFANTRDAYPGYALFSPTNSKETYLINNCGELVHNWTSTYLPGMSCYLMDNGTLLRTAKGGMVEMIDWNGNVIWSHTVLATHGRRHHDIELLPNGNILLIVHDDKTRPEVVKAGGIINTSSLTSEQIVEIKPDLVNGGATVVWEWKAWDHLIQDEDSLKDNYAAVTNVAEKIDLNYLDLNNSDWLHFNGIDYNEKLDQIIVSVLRFNEFWIIDHSTSTSQAATSTGGRYGKGGDLIYRWGNPQAYGQGGPSSQKLFHQHNAHWIPTSLNDEGKILLFNNQAGTPQSENYSTVNIIEPDVDALGFYNKTGGAYGPENFYWTYKANPPTQFFSKIISGAQRLENGNTLICAGVPGRFFEINNNSDIVWEYVNPVGSLGITAQSSPVSGNDVFRCEKYPLDFPGFKGKDLSPMGYIETGSTFTCDSFPEIEDAIETFTLLDPVLSPNPVKNSLRISINGNQSNDLVLDIYSVQGQHLMGDVIPGNSVDTEVNVGELPNGIYLIVLHNGSVSWTGKIVVSD